MLTIGLPLCRSPNRSDSPLRHLSRSVEEKGRGVRRSGKGGTKLRMVHAVMPQIPPNPLPSSAAE